MFQFATLFGIALMAVVTAELCSDIDSTACSLFLAAQPNYCSDISARSTCPRFCKLCPVECYDCNVTVLDYHDCNKTSLCPEGQICMRKELKSYLDGHHEYEMSCQSKEVCDGGPGLSIPFGKREIESRDISITCCADDLCNYPVIPTVAPTTKPVCPKDIVFLVDESSRVQQKNYQAVKNSIINVVSQLEIGPTSNLVGLYGYDSRVRDHIDLKKYTTKNALLYALNHISLDGMQGRGDTPDAIHFLVDHALKPTAGDRPSYPDVVVIIGDAVTTANAHISFSDQRDLIRDSQDIIIVTLGGTSLTSPPLDNLATDSHHVLHLLSANMLAEKLLPLITQC